MMRRFLFVLCLWLVLAAGPLSGTAPAAPGDLDPTFGTDGVTYVDLGTATSVLRSAVQPDGSVILICGDSGTPYLMRLTPEGQVDTHFGTDGRTRLDWTDTTSFDYWTWGRIWLQPMTGRIIIEGRAYSADGLPDDSYGGSGHPTSGEVGAMTPDGGFIWAGGSTVTRLAVDGALDASFGTNGSRTVSISKDWPIATNAVMIDKLGRIVMQGAIGIGDHFWLRLLPGGDLDTSFAGGGFEINRWGTRIMTPGPGDWIYAVWCQAKGIVFEFEADRIAPDGPVVPQTLFGVSNVSAWNLMPDGSWMVAGRVDNGFPSYWDIVVRRYTALGLPDETFANGGKIVLDFGSWDDTASVIARPDGRILIAGATQQGAPAVPALRTDAAGGSRSAATQRGMVVQLTGGSRTGLSVRLTKSPSASLVTLRLRSGRASWKTSAALKCSGTPVGAAKLVLMRSRDGRTWTAVFSKATGKTGTSATTVKFTRRGTYYFRWSFKATGSYRSATSARTKVVVK